ncbi:MAG: cupin domain-containing protein [Burkholderia gladioli]
MSAFGTRLRGLRAGRGLSLKQLAALSGVSTGMISQIERDLTSPSLRTLDLLRGALGVTLSELIEDAALAAVPTARAAQWVRRVADRPQLQVSAGGLIKEMLSPPGDWRLQFMLIHFPAHSASQDVMTGSGEKAGLVLDGTVILNVDGQRTRLDAGDSFQFDSRLPHQVENPEAGPVTVIWIMSVQPDDARI